MRISDWSSDVCSSDLAGEGGREQMAVAPGLFADLYPRRAHRRRRESRRRGRRGEGRAGGSARPLLEPRARRRRSRQARKSVGHGKRVSVRLGLGGRRIIKKKSKITCNATELTK